LIEKKLSFNELSIACTICARKHPVCKFVPTCNINVSLILCATDYPDLAELRMQSNKVGQGANRGAGSTRTGVFHEISSNVANPPVKIRSVRTTHLL